MPENNDRSASLSSNVTVETDSKELDIEYGSTLTPRSMVSIGIILAIASFAADMGAMIGLKYLALDESADASIWITFGVYIVPVVLALLAGVSLFVGALRWAVNGANSTKAPSSLDANLLLQKLESINRRLMLSETAKRIAYRAEDIEALRQAIRKDIDERDFNAAMILVEEMSQNFGYREEAEAFRDIISNARNAEIEAKVTEDVKKLDDILAQRDFPEALREANRIKRLYPDSPRAQSQHDRVMKSRAEYTKDLEEKFLAAAEKEDVDGAMTLLKELDKYLTEQEAAPYSEVARKVIAKKRESLGGKFKLSVQEKNWTIAKEVGEQIMQDFPNSRMADEVRNMLEMIQKRMSQQAAKISKI